MNPRRQLAGFLALIFVGIAPAWGSQLEGIRVWAAPDKTRTVIDLSEAVEYRIFSLNNPDRVVVDIKQTMAPDSVSLPKPDGALLDKVRTGKRNGTDLRIVFDLKDSVKPKSFLLPPADRYGHRLVIDLFPEDGTADAPKVEVPAVELQNRDIIVAIDAGHGGEDPGAIGAGGTYEKDVVLSIAREVGARIDALPGFKSVLIRESDYYVAHHKRTEIAREKRADLFLSIHADAFYDRNVRGSSVFVLTKNRATSEAARWLADRENRSDLVGGVMLDDKEDTVAAVLLDLSQSASMEASMDAAKFVFRSLSKVGRTHKKHVEKANLAVLTAPDIPSMLIETAFISNPDEEKRLKSRRGQREIAEAITEGVIEYFQRTPPPGTWLAANPDSFKKDRYIVARGDTLSGIARRHRVSLAALKRANQMSDDRVRAGEVLTIPAI